MWTPVYNVVYNGSTIRSRIVPYEIEIKRQRPNLLETQVTNIKPNNEYHIENKKNLLEQQYNIGYIDISCHYILVLHSHSYVGSIYFVWKQFTGSVFKL